MKKKSEIKKTVSKQDSQKNVQKGIRPSAIRKDEIPNLLKNRPFKIIFFT
ncbi:MAG: hypothetical protein M0Z70_07430 [Nitrospiraceae bacterium]|jgi:hypothetical protein|nr:hypothetical protein [Nitrospirota bacterium]MDA8339114.1 hypothetical protein [Nitrospiraceae bacterium]